MRTQQGAQTLHVVGAPPHAQQVALRGGLPRSLCRQALHGLALGTGMCSWAPLRAPTATLTAHIAAT